MKDILQMSLIILQHYGICGYLPVSKYSSFFWPSFSSQYFLMILSNKFNQLELKLNINQTAVKAFRFAILYVSQCNMKYFTKLKIFKTFNFLLYCWGKTLYKTFDATLFFVAPVSPLLKKFDATCVFLNF